MFLKKKLTSDLDFSRTDPRKMSYDDFLGAVKTSVHKIYDKKESEINPEAMRTLERIITLQVIDSKWRDHLYAMDELRDGIWTASYGEKNPLVEYKLQGFEMFNGMLDVLKQDILEYLLKVQIQEVIQPVQQKVEPVKIGNEFHAEVAQFGSGGIPLAASQPQMMRNPDRQQKEEHEAVGGVKRKKTRRSRRG